MRNLRFASLLSTPLIVSLLTIGALMSSLSAKAQWEVTTVTIPFAFQTEYQKMPAGVYRIKNVSENLLLLHGPNQVATLVPVHAAIAKETPTKGSVVFHRYGETYFLGEFWTASAKDGAECFKSRAEKEMILASKHQVPSMTTLAFDSVTRR